MVVVIVAEMVVVAVVVEEEEMVVLGVVLVCETDEGGLEVEVEEAAKQSWHRSRPGGDCHHDCHHWVVLFKSCRRLSAAAKLQLQQ